MNSSNTRQKDGTARAIMPALLFPALVALLSVTSYSQEREAATDPDTGRVKFHSGFYDLFAQKSSMQQTSIDGINEAFDVRYQHALGTFDLSAAHERFDITHENTVEGLKFSLQRNVQSLGIGYERKIGWFGIGAKAEFLRTTDEQLCNYEAGLSASFQQGVEKNYELIYRRATLPFVLSATYETENLKIVNPASMSAVVQTLRYRFSPVVVSAGYSRWFPHSKGKDFYYSFTNTSTADEYTASLAASGERSEYQIDVHNIAFRTDGDFIRQGMEFGFLNIDAFNFLETEASLAHRYESGSILSLAARYYRLNGSLIGSLESWPFTTVVQSLFLNRIYFRASGVVDAEEVDASFAFTTGGIRILPQCSLIRVVPDLTWETWQPLLLAFGMANYSKSELSFTEAGLCYLRAAAAFDAWGVQIGIEGHQLIPLYSVARETTAPSPAQPSNGGVGSTSTDGGRWFRITIGLPM